MKKFLILTIILTFLCLPFFGQAQDVLGEETIFNIEASYDATAREQITATIIKISPTAYWYVDNDWWTGLNVQEQEEVGQSLDSLTGEFEINIYPTLTRTFGYEWTPGIDKDTRLTVLIHLMKEEMGGYSDTADEYYKSQIPESNEREMVYLNAQHINSANAKVFLAHEFVHLITFNQKNKTHNVSEDVWLNEARAEYSATLLGYNQEYQGSNLQKRVKDFIERPSDSLTEWRETAADYGVVNLFTHYLVDHYGTQVLAESLQMKQTGIESLNTVLTKYGFKIDFSQVFTNWTIANLINDCKVSEEYCYYNKNLEGFRITPLMNYLPFVGDSTLSVNNTTKDWSGNWHKFIGGNGTLYLEFKGTPGVKTQVPYVTVDAQGNISVNNLVLNQNKEGEILLEKFGSQNTVLTIIPVFQQKTSDFLKIEASRNFFWSVSTREEEQINIPSLSPLTKPISQMTRQEVLNRIAEINAVIIALQKILVEIAAEETSCQSITQNLYFGMTGNYQVICLQEFLKGQGVYPEGIVNGNFFTLTQRAVIRFQEKYAQEILAPLELQEGTGYVGSSTRAKINQLLK